MREGATSKKVRKIVAKECGLAPKSVTNKTDFMGGQKIRYFDCMGALFALQHEFHVSLPESSYQKYTTVGGLVRDIVRQLKTRSK